MQQHLLQRANWLAGLMLILAVFGLKSCDHSYIEGLDDLEDYNYSPVVAIPLVDSEMSIEDLFDLEEEENVEIDQEDLIKLIYSGQIFSIPAKDLFHVPDQQQSFTETVDPSTKSSYSFDKVFLVAFDNDEILTSITFMEGLLNISTTADQLRDDGYQLEVNYEIQNFYNDQGVPITDAFDLDNPSSVDLSGSTLNFDNEANFFLIEYSAVITGDGSPDNAPYDVTFNQSITGIEYELLQGYIDQISFPVGNTSVGIGIFSNSNLGNIYFENPYIELTARNSFGAEIDLNVDNFFAKDSADQTIPIHGSILEDPWRIEGPAAPPDDLLVNEVTLNRDNTNIIEVMEGAPQEIYYEVNGTINPEGIPQTINFIKHDSDLIIDMKVNLPLWGRVEVFEMQDTLELSLDDIPDEIEWLELKLEMTNGFPINSEVEAVLINKNEQGQYEVLDTLFKDNPKLIEAATVDPITDKVEEPRVKTTLELLSENQIESLKQATDIIIIGKLNTFDHESSSSVKILDSYRMGVKIGARIKGNVNVEFE